MALGTPHKLFTFLSWAVLAAAVAGLLAAGVWKQRAAGREPLPVLAEVPDFALERHDGGTLSLADLAGAPWVADFVFTRCVAICPRMSAEMRRLRAELGTDSTARLVSVTVDPEHDTPEVLADYARRWDADADAGPSWLFLTGEVEEIHDLTRRGFLLPLDPTPAAQTPAARTPNEAVPVDFIVHSNRFVLVDGRGRIRGYYDAFDPAEMERLRADVESLSG